MNKKNFFILKVFFSHAFDCTALSVIQFGSTQMLFFFLRDDYFRFNKIYKTFHLISDLQCSQFKLEVEDV